LALVAFREPNGGDTRWPQEIRVLADIRELIFAAAMVGSLAFLSEMVSQMRERIS
jgi:hypothetical protein